MLVAALGLATLSLFPSQAQARAFYGAPNVQSVVLNNFATRDAQLRSQIASEVNTGQLSPVVANNLTNELNSISAQEQSAMAFGGLNDAQIAQFNNMFTDITNQLNASVASVPYGVVAPAAFGYAAPYVAAAPVYVAPAPVYSARPVWRGINRDVRDFRDARNVDERPIVRQVANNWQANRQFDRERFAGAPRQQVAAPREQARPNVHFDGHRR